MDRPALNRDLVVFDLDGTLANTDHRQHYVRNPGIPGFVPDWDKFFRACVHDTPVPEIVILLRHFVHYGYRVMIASGRSDMVMGDTWDWLDAHVLHGLDREQLDRVGLLMRRAEDHRPDHLVKRGWLDAGLIDQSRVLVVFDDRDAVVQMWREAGLVCCQVAPGAF